MYYVSATPQGLLPIVDFKPPCDRVEDALARARAFRESGATDISIRDSKRNHIAGRELEDALDGVAMGITSDLKPVYRSK